MKSNDIIKKFLFFFKKHVNQQGWAIYCHVTDLKFLVKTLFDETTEDDLAL